MSEASAFKVLYDGECPFCRSYVALARLRDAVGRVELIDAREAPELVSLYAGQGYPVDQGMIVDSGEAIYWGGDAVWAINSLISPNPALKFLGGRRFLKWIYPALKFGRNTALRLMGRKPIQPAQPACRG